MQATALRLGLSLLALLAAPGGEVRAHALGAAFQPYIGNWTGSAPGAAVPLFNSYTNDDIQSMLEVMHPHFDKITTYSAGYAGYYSPSTPYDQVDSNWRVAGVAASLNAARVGMGSHAIVVAQGIFQQVQSGSILNGGGTAANALMAAEIEGARTVANAANALHPGTVTRLVFTNEYVTDAATTSAVDLLITSFRTAHPSSALGLGVRSNTFGQLTDPQSPYLSELQSLVANCDFIMLNLYPSAAVVETSMPSVAGMQAAIDEIAAQYDAIEAAATALNAELEVLIGETGWPTAGKSFNDLDGDKTTPDYAYAYFEALSAWANANAVESYVFEGIDEPWKSNRNQVGGNVWTGPDGAEGHFGIWKLSAGALPGGGITTGDLAYKYPGPIEFVPEPSGGILLVSGCLQLGFEARRRRRRPPRR